MNRSRKMLICGAVGLEADMVAIAGTQLHRPVTVRPDKLYTYYTCEVLLGLGHDAVDHLLLGEAELDPRGGRVREELSRTERLGEQALDGVGGSPGAGDVQGLCSMENERCLIHKHYQHHYFNTAFTAVKEYSSIFT
jgi:hypothetical protein